MNAATTGPDGKKVKGVYWANLQLQFNGPRKKGQSTSFAEVHAMADKQFTALDFQNAFLASIHGDGGYAVWMY